jgi:hypothetical protein
MGTRSSGLVRAAVGGAGRRRAGGRGGSPGVDRELDAAAATLGRADPPIDQLAAARHRRDLRRAGGELPRRAGRAARLADSLRQRAPRGGRGEHGGGRRQADRPPRRVLRDPRAGGDARLGRRAHGVCRLDADDLPGRAGAATAISGARRCRSWTCGRRSLRSRSGPNRSRSPLGSPSWSGAPSRSRHRGDPGRPSWRCRRTCSRRRLRSPTPPLRPGARPSRGRRARPRARAAGRGRPGR